MVLLCSSQFKAFIERTLKKKNTCKNTTPFSVAVLEVAQSTLRLFGPDDSSSTSSNLSTYTPPKAAEVMEYIQELMIPSASQFFNASFFEQLIFSFVTLYKVASMFSSDEVHDDYLRDLDIIHAYFWN